MEILKKLSSLECLKKIWALVFTLNNYSAQGILTSQIAQNIAETF